MKKIFTLILASVMLISAITLLPSKVSAEEFNSKDYSGEDLFRGILFGYGDVGKQFPELWEETDFKNLKVEEEFIDGVKELESKLKEKDSEYFVKFKDNITSGDRLKIKSQIEKINKDVTILGKEYEKEMEDSSEKEIQQAGIKPGFVVLLAYSYVGATHIAAAAVLTVVVAGHKIYPKLAPNESGQSGLSEDKYIDLIAKKMVVK